MWVKSEYTTNGSEHISGKTHFSEKKDQCELVQNTPLVTVKEEQNETPQNGYPTAIEVPTVQAIPFSFGAEPDRRPVNVDKQSTLLICKFLLHCSHFKFLCPANRRWGH